MSKFLEFRTAIQKQFDIMAASGTLFISDVSKEDIWDTYLSSFPEGTNNLFRERTEHDCVCCKQFIRNVGRVVGEVNGEFVSVFDVTVDSYFQEVADALSSLNKSNLIGGLFLHNEREIGKPYTIEAINTPQEIKWDHYHQVVPDSAYRKDGIGEEKGAAQTNRKVLKRSLEEITADSVETVIELIAQDSIYRGAEHKSTLTLLKTLQQEYNTVEHKDLYLWKKAVDLRGVSAIRNTVIGSLLVDISKGVDLEVAVKKFEDKAAPSNYKRSKSLITEKMKQSAQARVKELGIEPSFLRRHATKSDISVNNVVFADQSVQPFMEDSIFDVIKTDKSISVKSFDKVTEMPLEKFISDVLPTASSVELYLENKLEKNLMTLVAPQHPSAPNILNWGNNFSWSYNGDFTDGFGEEVKKAGGSLDGVLRFSIKWNDTAHNLNDLDAHCITPAKGLIYFGNRRDNATGGNLDVDIQSPEGLAVENIVFPKVVEGDYKFIIHNYSDRGGSNWEAELAFDDQLLHFSFKGSMRGLNKQQVVVVNYSKVKGFTIKESMDYTGDTHTKPLWNLDSNNFHKVSMIMNSPNHWEGECTGNKHTFFILDECKNPESVRGFYNEYLSPELKQDRKVFEVLASQLKAEYNEDQLSGVGISSTVRNEVIFKVTGKTSRVIKVKF